MPSRPSRKSKAREREVKTDLGLSIFTRFQDRLQYWKVSLTETYNNSRNYRNNVTIINIIAIRVISNASLYNIIQLERQAQKIQSMIYITRDH